jgi:hypothetical protein
MTESAPLVRTLTFSQGAVGAASSQTSMLGEAPFNGTITSVTYTPGAAITGANTNTRQQRLVNRGQAGSGTTVAASLQYDLGVNGVAGDERAITLSGAPANLAVATGDILAFESNAVGTGLADPGGLVQVEISRS